MALARRTAAYGFLHGLTVVARATLAYIATVSRK